MEILNKIQVPFYDLSVQHAMLRQELDAAYSRIIGKGQFILGQELQDFEASFASYCGSSHGIGVANGLDALRLALQALGIGAGCEVIVPAHTFVATWLAVTAAGATPIACEPAAGGFNIDRQMAEPLITPRTRAILPVHLYGIPAPADELASLCNERKLTMIEDAAQAHGARIGQAACGSIGKAGCFSFYPSKNLGALGDGGAIVTSDIDLAARIRQLRNYGSAEKYKIEEQGCNSRLDEIQAAFLHVKLSSLERSNQDRRRIAAAYVANLSDVDQLRLPEVTAGQTPVWHLFVIRTQQRDALREHLACHGIETGVHYPVPVYRMPPFAAYGPDRETETDRISREIVSLPMWPYMPDSMVMQVCRAIRSFFGVTHRS